MKYVVPSVETAARMLMFLKNGRERTATFSEVCRAVGVPKSTGFNILKTLRHFNLVDYDEETKRYSLGWALVELGGAAADRHSYISLARPYARVFSQETGLTCVLAQRVRDTYVLVDRIDGYNELRVTAPVGQSHPLSFGAQGKAFLAYLPESEVDAQLRADGLPRHTAQTIVDFDAFKQELRKVRIRGYAESREEYTSGVNSLAAPIFDAHGEVVLIISALGFTSFLSCDKMPEYGERLRSLAANASSAIGGCGYVEAGQRAAIS